MEGLASFPHPAWELGLLGLELELGGAVVPVPAAVLALVLKSKHKKQGHLKLQVASCCKASSPPLYLNQYT
jgi:hypothetical protein